MKKKFTLKIVKKKIIRSLLKENASKMRSKKEEKKKLKFKA